MFDNELSHLDVVLTDLRVSTQKQAYSILAGYIAKEHKLCSQDVLDKILQQEQLSPAGIGHGVALAHIVMPDIEKPVLGFMQFKNLIDFKALDNMPVDLCVLLISPQEGALHLRRLSAISRFLRDTHICNSLRSAESDDAVRAIWTTADQFKMAA